jgi:hypothetical protein
MRFSAAVAFIGLTGFTNISAKCCGIYSAGSINLRDKFAHPILPLSNMGNSNGRMERTRIFWLASAGFFLQNFPARA